MVVQKAMTSVGQLASQMVERSVYYLVDSLVAMKEPDMVCEWEIQLVAKMVDCSVQKMVVSKGKKTVAAKELVKVAHLGCCWDA